MAIVQGISGIIASFHLRAPNLLCHQYDPSRHSSTLSTLSQNHCSPLTNKVLLRPLFLHLRHRRPSLTSPNAIIRRSVEMAHTDLPATWPPSAGNYKYGPVPAHIPASEAWNAFPHIKYNKTNVWCNAACLAPTKTIRWNIPPPRSDFESSYRENATLLPTTKHQHGIARGWSNNWE